MPTTSPKFLRNTIHGWAVTLQRHELDDDAIRYFNQGQCHALAYALHKKLGLPMLWLECPWWEDITHCAVAISDTLYLDVTGIHDLDDYGYIAHEVPNPEAFMLSCDGSVNEDDLEWMVPDMYLANHFANVVIDKYALDISEHVVS